MCKTSVGFDKLKEHLKRKKESFSVKVTTTIDGVRVTTRINGDLKNKFFSDCIDRNYSEADLNRKIIDIYYSILKERPELKNEGMVQVKQWIIDKIKFK